MAVYPAGKCNACGNRLVFHSENDGYVEGHSEDCAYKRHMKNG